MTDPRNAAMTQHLEHQHREQVTDLLKAVLADLAYVKTQLAALAPKQKPAKE